MIKRLLLFGVLLFTLNSFAQIADNKLSVMYSPEQLTSLKNTMPGSIEYMNYYVNHSYRIVDYPTGKPVETIELKKIDPISKEVLNDEITLNDIRDFNPYKFNCKPQMNKQSYYKIGNTGKMLIMLSHKEIQRGFKQWKTKNK